MDMPLSHLSKKMGRGCLRKVSAGEESQRKWENELGVYKGVLRVDRRT